MKPIFMMFLAHMGASPQVQSELATVTEAVVYSQGQGKLVGGPRGRLFGGLVLLSTAWHESRYRWDVQRDLRPKNGCFCMLQINLGPSGRTQEGWAGVDLAQDVRKCFWAGYRLMRQSFGACQGPVEDRLAAYTSGSCSRGLKESRARVLSASRWYNINGPFITDEVAMKEASIVDLINLIEDKERTEAEESAVDYEAVHADLYAAALHNQETTVTQKQFAQAMHRIIVGQRSPSVSKGYPGFSISDAGRKPEVK